jgi:hypothetical protein
MAPTESSYGSWWSGAACVSSFLSMRQKIRDTYTHHQLQDDLVDYLERRGLVSPILTMISIMQNYDFYFICVTPLFLDMNLFIQICWPFGAVGGSLGP